MNSKRILIFFAVAAGAAAIVVAPLAIRGGMRFHRLNKVLSLPHARERLAMKPTRRTLVDNQKPIQLVNLGYAAFDTYSTNHLFIESSSSGAAITLTNLDVSMAFLPPQGPEKSATLEWEMAVEETQPLPPIKIILMNEGGFAAYWLNVSFKAGNRIGSNGVEFFQSPYAKGIAWIGKNKGDTRFANVYFASPDGAKNVGLLLQLPASSTSNVSDYLEPILRSFRFTAERVDDQETVKALIRDAGIPQRKEAQTDD